MSIAQVSQATQDNRNEATQAVENLRSLIQSLEDSVDGKPTSEQWDEMQLEIKKLRDQNENLWENCAKADATIQELQTSLLEERKNSQILKKKIRGLESKVQDLEKRMTAPRFNLFPEGKFEYVSDFGLNAFFNSNCKACYCVEKMNDNKLTTHY
jgi:chromosome segregation ATPase